MDDKVTARITGGLSVFWMKKLDKSLSFKESLEDIKRRLGKAHYYKEPTIGKLRARLQEYDVIYSKNELIEGFLLRFLLRYKNLPPVIFGGHTPIYYPIATSFHSKLHNFLYGSYIYRFLAGGVQKFHALNDADAARFRKLFPRRSVQRIYNPFDVESFRRGARTHTYDISGFDKTAIHILWLGRLSEQKGIDDLDTIIPAVNARADSAGVAVAWSIFGDGELRSIAEMLSNTYPNVTYCGHAEQAYAPSVYAQHQLFVNTSKWEGYPYTLIECQAFGLQAFAYDIPGPRDILQAYDGGHIAADREQLIELLAKAIVTYRRPEKVPASQPSEQFKPDLIYQQLLDFFSLTRA
jgi:glycosyltransferase involved in cell wall biosynthesis